MARTKDQSFVNAYLNRYQQNQKNAVYSGQQAASNAASGGVQQMNSTGNINLPSLYDPSDDLYSYVIDQQKAQIKAQQAAAKAAQKAAKEADNAREQMIKDNIQKMRDVAKMNRDKQKRVRKIMENMPASNVPTLTVSKKKTGTSSDMPSVNTEAKPYIPPYDDTGRPNFIDRAEAKKKTVPSRGQDLPDTVRNSTHGRLGRNDSDTAPKTKEERSASAYASMSTAEKLEAAQNLSAQSQALQNQIDALERQKIEPKTGAGAYDEEAYAIVQKNRQIVEQQDALKAQRPVERPRIRKRRAG